MCSSDLLDNTPEQIFGIASQTMPEIKGAMLRVESAEYALRAARGGFSPRVTLSAVAQSNYASISDTQRTMIDGFQLGTTPVGVVGGTNQPVFTYQPVYKVIAPDYGVGNQLSDNVFKALSMQVSVPLFNGLQARSSVQRAAVNKSLEIGRAHV